MKKKYDIIVIGGGPAGLCFARAVSRTGLKIAVLEKQPETVLADPGYDGREIALTHHSRKLMGELGLWDLVPPDGISLIRDAKVLNGRSDYALHFNHREAGEDNLGFMISNHLIRKAAYDAVKQCSNVTLMAGAEVETLETDDTAGGVTLADKIVLEAPLIVAAVSSAAWNASTNTTRQLMNVSITTGRSLCCRSITARRRPSSRSIAMTVRPFWIWTRPILALISLRAWSIASEI